MPSPNASNCVILVPVGSDIVPSCEQGLRELEARGYTVRRVRGYAAIDQARNQMASDALADGFNELMWIDADIGFNPDDVDRLRRRSLPIVCGIYPQKGRRTLACHVMPGSEKLVFGSRGEPTEVLYAGTGFLLTRSEVYHSIREKLQLPLCNQRFGGRPIVPYFLPLVREDGAGHWYLAEDYAFCHRARLCDYRIMADTAIRLWHYGTYGYSWEDAGSEVQRFETYDFYLNG